MLEIDLFAIEYFIGHAVRDITDNLFRTISILFTVTCNQVLIKHLGKRRVHELFLSLFGGILGLFLL